MVGVGTFVSGEIAALLDDEAVRIEKPASLPRRRLVEPLRHHRCHRKIGPICDEQSPPEQRGERGHRIACHIPMDELKRVERISF